MQKIGQRDLLVEARMNFVVTAFTGMSNRKAGGISWWKISQENFLAKNFTTNLIVVTDVRLYNWNISLVSLP